MTGLISAVPFESAEILARMKGVRTIRGGIKTGVIEGRNAAYICSGIGIANAAMAITLLSEIARPQCIILFGIGGAYPHSGLSIGEVAAASGEVYADSGINTGKKTAGFKETGFPLLKIKNKKYFNSFPLSKNMLVKAKKTGISAGVFLTVCAASRSRQRALALERDFSSPLIENMEGAAAAHAALACGVPLLEIRGVSNIAGDHPSKWRLKEAAINCQKTVFGVLSQL
ncbi:MAG: futalosine hydrolase [Actinomycetota bacterium]|nr:futalosine hydrolase [Actinomycetota bacterium]